MKDKLVKLLKQIDAEISEDHIAELVSVFETKLTEAKEAGYSDGIGKVSEIDADYSKKLEEAVDKVKTDYETQLNEMDDDHASKLQELVEAIDEDHSTKLETLVEAIDEDHSAKLETLVETIDKDHTSKLETLVEAIDEDHTSKLEHIVESYEEHYENLITEKVQGFISTYIKESIPEEKAIEQARLQKLQESVSKIREILFFSDEYVNTEIKEAIKEAKNKIDGEKGKVNRLMVENMDLKQTIMKKEAMQLLEQKTESMKPALAAYVKEYFDKVYDAKEIDAKLNEAVEAFTNHEDSEKQKVVEEKERGIQPIIDIPQEEEMTINESDENDDDIMDIYVNKYKRSNSKERN